MEPVLYFLLVAEIRLQNQQDLWEKRKNKVMSDLNLDLKFFDGFGAE